MNSMRGPEQVFKIILRYKGKDYTCVGDCWYDEGWETWRSASEFDGVRNCEHDYASLLPLEVQNSEDWGCEQKEIEVVDYWFEDKPTEKYAQTSL